MPCTSHSFYTASAFLALAVIAACGRSTPKAASTAPVGPDTVAQGHDWETFDWDVGRSGASTAPTGITAQNVASLTVQQVQLGGTVDASAIYLSAAQINGAPHAAFFVTTTYGLTIAVNANTGAVLWTYTPPGYASWAGTAQITNSTPVADPDGQYIYSASPDGHVQKLAVSDGQAVWSTAITLGPQTEKIASPLTYFAGRIIAMTGGYVGDAPPYQGHIAIVNATSGQILHVWNSLCSDQLALLPVAQCSQTKSAIWGRAGAVVDSTTGDIYFSTGNGYWDGDLYWGDATLRLDSSATQLLGNYTPTNTQTLYQTDTDLGSTSPVFLGDGYIVQGGKDGTIRLLSTSAMAGTAPHKGGEIQTVPTPGSTDLFTAPAVLRTATDTLVFVADNDGTAAWGVSAGQLSQVWQNTNPGTSPVVAGGLLFVYDATGSGLRVYQASTGALVATLPCGSGHWNSPIVADGRIALPEGSANNHQTTGILDIWRASAN